MTMGRAVISGAGTRIADRGFKTCSERRTVPICSEDCANLGQSPQALKPFFASGERGSFDPARSVLSLGPCPAAAVFIPATLTYCLSKNRLGEGDSPILLRLTAQNWDSPRRFSDRLLVCKKRVRAARPAPEVESA